MERARQKLRIDVYSDVVCPWCYIGATRLRQVLESLDKPLDVEIHYKTYLLDPGVPPEGKDLGARLEQKYGMPAKELFARPEAVAHELGLPLDFSKVRVSFNSLNAQTLLRHVPEGKQGAFAQALFEAYFLRNDNISRADVLLPLAEACGLPREQAKRLLDDDAERQATLLAADNARKRGVRGVPTFVFNDKVGFSGAQPEAIFRQAIDEAMS